MSAVEEAEQASVAFQAALTRIGVATIAEALSLWQRVNPAKAAATANAWLDDAVEMILSRRGQSRELAIAYYRLVRALRTGRTVPSPYDPKPTSVTIGQLRAEFAELVDSTRPRERITVAPPRTSREEPRRPLQVDPEDAPYEPARSGADEDVPIETLDGSADLAREVAEMEREWERELALVEDEIRIDLEALGPASLQQAVDQLDGEAPADEVDTKRDKAHGQAGARQAAAAERIVMDGGRGELYARARRDRRAVGFIRLSRSGTPCGWCAMLISRGPVYFSRASAEHSADGDKYHDNCHCYAEPVWSVRDYRDSERYALNRQYEKEWPEVTKGLSGKAAVSAWRRHIRIQQRKARSQRTTETAQEASA
ncbi:hypothetical protein ABRQ22_14950 [Cellulosimicrobium sp. ES-005]|uniref:Capsid maturation protease n=1 Tax=Cellulosimicrobium sp. ES-005 TaxID=3163031 RepID=A0AAU8FWB0_9MICO